MHSYLPHEGRVDLFVHETIDELRVRVPSWVDPQRASLEVAGDDGDRTRWDGPFLAVTDVPAGAEVGLTFPVWETETVEVAADREFVVGWRGDDVVSITPSGTHAPLYDDRDVYDAVPLIDVAFRRGADLEW